MSNRAHELLTPLYRDENCDGKGLISPTGLTTRVINDDVERMKDGSADFSALQTRNVDLTAKSCVKQSCYHILFLFNSGVFFIGYH